MSEAKPYFYETEIEWKGEKDLKLASGKLPVIDAGAPPEFKGKENNWSPEHLFVASLNTCYTLTLLAIAEFSKIALVSVSSKAKGKLEKVQGSGFQITEIAVKPRVVLASANDLRACRESWKKLKRIVSSPTRSKALSKSNRKYSTGRRPWGEAPSSSSETQKS